MGNAKAPERLQRWVDSLVEYGQINSITDDAQDVLDLLADKEAECEALREVAREAHAGLVYTYHAYMKPPSETDGRYEESMFVWNLEPEARDMMLPNEQALFDALIKARAALTTSVQACRKCGGTMKPGKATGQMLVGGMPDFPGDKHAVTLTHGGPGKMIDCMKCVECGWSVTSDSEGGE